MIARAVMIGGALSIVNAVPALAQEAASQAAGGQEVPEGSPPGVGTSAAQEQTAVAATSLPGETAAQQLGEILVTARRRDERAQDIPIAMAVVGGETIVKTGTQNVAQLAQIQPSVNYYATNPRNAAINIRGLGAPLGLTNDGLEQGVGVYVDQVYYSRIGTAVLDFFDVQRVEVLRGPQGTLYGKNTTAGAINVSTNKPTFTPEAYAEATLGNLELLQVRGAISGPVSDKVAVRVAAGGTSRRGTIFNVTSDRWVNERKNYGFRSHILWKPTETFDLLLSGDYGRQNTEAGAQIYVREGATQRPLNRQFASLAAAFNYAPPSTDPYDRVTDLDAKLLAGQKTGGVSLKGDIDVGFGTLTSVTAWRIWKWYPSSDRDFIGIPITTVSANPSRHRQFTQEVRLSSTGDNKLDYLLGAFYFTQRFKTSGAQEQGPAASRWLLNPGNVRPGTPGCATPTANACNPSVLNGLRSDNDIGYKSTSAALFGQLTWNISEALRIQPGLRLNYDKKDGSYEAVVRTGAGSTTLNNDQRNTLPPQAYAEKLDEWNVAYDLAASYDITPDVLA
jgi:iron complex outermembrane receptor protein